MEKIKYEFDPHNRLTVRSAALRGIRKVLDGQFRIADHNTLIYHIKAPIPDDIKAPHQVALKGAWSLTEDHQLRLALDQLSRKTFGDQLTLQGEILDAQKNSLLFAVTTRTNDNMPSSYILELSGWWQADEHNRLTFRVDKGNNEFDALKFSGAWEIDKNYQIAYSFQKQKLTRKNKSTHTLIFKGRWDIKDKARLAFVLEGDSDSRFDFNTSAGIFKDNYIKYELGIGLSRKRQMVRRVVTFFGEWKIKKNIGLVFEVKQGKGKIQEIVFGAEAKLTNKDTVTFNLRNNLNKELGAELEFSHDLFGKDGQAFLRLLKSKPESAVLLGFGCRW